VKIALLALLVLPLYQHPSNYAAIEAQASPGISDRLSRSTSDMPSDTAALTCHTLVLDDAPLVMLLAILEPFARSQKHDGFRLWPSLRFWE